jgi:hypothetical protein
MNVAVGRDEDVQSAGLGGVEQLAAWSVSHPWARASSTVWFVSADATPRGAPLSKRTRMSQETGASRLRTANSSTALHLLPGDVHQLAVLARQVEDPLQRGIVASLQRNRASR